MLLTELKRGEQAKIIKIGDIGELKKRLIDMGVTSGEIISFKRNAPLGDPKQYVIRNTNIAIRKKDAKKIIIEKI
ncbi:ferrous iron transport protein A [Hypnocyclicus thermotrophus]|uniref:Ferrous iron transport protein A n=1 Tax=Hypnocyclicus thermotrophus TaxID=1627895 RepID=A0AA46DWW9_9FUSO|nr:FeoA family protein [Hypnocyclicus thermotrophus]TDT67349.1 ferrous iron transport protein A [Hypnocyclicus thermotrophus]